jgi:hypothetical protein
VPSLTSDLVNEHQALSVGLFQFAYDLTYAGQDRTERQRQPIQPAAVSSAGLLSIANVVQPGIPDRPALGRIVELLAVIRQKSRRTRAAPRRPANSDPSLPFQRRSSTWTTS